MEGIEAKVVEGMGWAGGEVGLLPGSEFHADGSGAGGAGEAKALWEATGVVGAEFAVLCVDDADAVDEVFGFEFDKACRGAAEGAEGEALLFRCDAVKEFFFIIIDLGEAGVAVLDGIFGGGKVDHGELVASVALAVSKGFGGEDFGKFKGICKGALDYGGEEGGGVVADGEWSAIVGVSTWFGDGDSGGFLGADGGDSGDKAEVDEFVEGQVVGLGEAGEDVEGEAFMSGFGGGAGNGVEEVGGGVGVGVGVGWVEGVVRGVGGFVVEGPGKGSRRGGGGGRGGTCCCGHQ